MNHSIIQKSQLEGAKRIDAEYYQSEYLGAVQKLGNTKTVADLAEDVMYGLYVEPDYKQEGVNFIRALNLGDFCIDGEILKIDKKLVPQNYLLQSGDALIVRSGANTGDVGLVYDEFTGATFGSYVIRIRFNDKINPFFATMFLNSKYGVAQTKRLQTGMAQPNLNIPNIKEIKIPDYIDQNSQKNIEKIVFEGDVEKKRGDGLYQQAEALLLAELNFADFQQDNFLSTAVNLSEAQTANRFDAEFFNSKYEKMIKQLSEQPNYRLENYISDYSTGFVFKSENYRDSGIPLIRINNIKKGILDLKNTAYLSKQDFLLSPKDTAKPGDIVLSMSGTIGNCALIPDDMPQSSINQRILKFISKNIESNYLVLLLNSIIGNSQLERISTGGVQKNISYKDIKNILIPILPTSTQEKIADLVVKSHQARKKAKELLEEAKLKVEEMIENGGK